MNQSIEFTAFMFRDESRNEDVLVELSNGVLWNCERQAARRGVAVEVVVKDLVEFSPTEDTDNEATLER